MVDSEPVAACLFTLGAAATTAFLQDELPPLPRAYQMGLLAVTAPLALSSFSRLRKAARKAELPASCALKLSLGFALLAVGAAKLVAAA